MLLLSSLAAPSAMSPAAASEVSTTPVRAVSLLSEDQLVDWWYSRQPRTICNRSTWVSGVWTCLETVPYEFRAGSGSATPRSLIRHYLREGAREGIASDVAFMQGILETAWFFYPESGQVRPGDNNFAGMGAFDSGTHRPFQFPDVATGVRAQLQHLRLYADPGTATDGSNLGSPLAQDLDGRYPPRWRAVRNEMLNGQPRYAGRVPMWEGFGGGMWATDPAYGTKILNLYRHALSYNGFDPDAASAARRSCDPPSATNAEWPASGGLVSHVRPTRVLDTRSSDHGPEGPLGRAAMLEIPVAGAAGVPSDDVLAVVGNLTAVGVTRDTYITAWPSGTDRPSTSTLNPRAHQTVANEVVIPIGPDGAIQVYNHRGQSHLLFDVTGFIPRSSAYSPTTPTRLLDTRDPANRPFAAAETRTLPIGGTPDDIAAAVVNVTTVGATELTHVTAWPGGQQRPLTSSLNPRPGKVSSNELVVPVGSDGTIRLYNHRGEVHLIVDLSGVIHSSGAYQAITPTRILDSRDGTGGVSVPVGAGVGCRLPVVGRAGIPQDGVKAVIVNLTAVTPTQPSFITSWPGATTRPFASTLNPSPEDIVTNEVILPVGTDGAVNLYNHSGNVHLIADVVGYLR